MILFHENIIIDIPIILSKSFATHSWLVEFFVACSTLVIFAKIYATHLLSRVYFVRTKVVNALHLSRHARTVAVNHAESYADPVKILHALPIVCPVAAVIKIHSMQVCCYDIKRYNGGHGGFETLHKSWPVYHTYTLRVPRS